MAYPFKKWPTAKLKKYVPRVDRLRAHFVFNQDFDRAAAMRDRREAMAEELKERSTKRA